MLEKILLHKIKCVALAHLSREVVEDMKLDLKGAVSEMLVMQLIAKIYTEDVETIPEIARISYPANWWEHFRQTYLPAWILSRWPIKQRTIVRRADVTKFAAYPKLPAAMNGKQGPTIIHYRVAEKDEEENE